LILWKTRQTSVQRTFHIQ